MQWADASGDMLRSDEKARLRKEAVTWVIRLQNDGLSPEDWRAFDAWQSRSSAHALIFEKVFSVWDSPDLHAAAVAAAEAERSRFKSKPAFVGNG